MSLTIDPDTLLQAYQMGLFPMADEDEAGEEQLAWYAPDPRGVIPLEDFHIPRGLRRALKKQEYEIRKDTAFAEVIERCADREETWISAGIRQSYTRLYELGWAHSVEAWYEGELMGGLYGVAIGGAFFGESMFSRRTDASKVALVHLVKHLRERGFSLLDTQWSNPHLKQFGCLEISRDSYNEQLKHAVQIETKF
ncbi:MAG: leucyl/phenylalanyl-tRNA--protein transferase [Verrucomicrobiales bacterium]|nr:leucyl/phenylalanyl-tRNA--protein transferase [Verrucomicrobiales bacterium]